MNSFPKTSSAWARLVATARSLLAQVFLGWAMAMSTREVMETVVGGVLDAERRCGVPANTWARSVGLIGRAKT